MIVLGTIGAVVGEDSTDQYSETSSQPAKSAAPEDPEPLLGTRQNPYPIGEAATFTVRALGDADYSAWSLVVDEPGTDITDAIASENMFNPSPDDGSLYFGVPVSLTLLEAGKEPLDTFWNIDFEVMGKESMSLSDMGFFGCGVVPKGFDQNQQVFIGGTLSGVLCFEVSEKDFEAGVMLTVDERDRVFLDAGPAQIGTVTEDGVDPSGREADSATADDAAASTSTPAAPEASSDDAADPGAGSPGSFRYESRISGYVWEGEIFGYTFESANSLSDDDVQRCAVVVGTMSPLVAEDYGLTSGLSNPEISLLVDGRVLESGIFGCDNDQATDAGYRSPLFERMTAGSEFPFYVSFELPAALSEPGTIEVIVGDTDNDGYQRIEATYLDTIPPGAFLGEPLPLDAVQPAGTLVSHDGGESQWQVFVEGVVVLDAVGRSGGGSCVIVLGTMTPTDTGGALVADGSSTHPLISIVVGGLARSSDFGSCQDDAAEQAGYEDPFYADVAAGTVYHFYDATYLPPSVDPAVEAVSIGLAMFDDIMLIEAPVLSSIPEAQP